MIINDENLMKAIELIKKSIPVIIKTNQFDEYEYLRDDKHEFIYPGRYYEVVRIRKINQIYQIWIKDEDYGKVDFETSEKACEFPYSPKEFCDLVLGKIECQII